jgi:hypothetical protein
LVGLIYFHVLSRASTTSVLCGTARTPANSRYGTELVPASQPTQTSRNRARAAAHFMKYALVRKLSTSYIEKYPLSNSNSHAASPLHSIRPTSARRPARCVRDAL